MPWNPAAAGSTSQQDPDNAYPAAQPSTILASAARTANGNMGNSGVDCTAGEAVALELIVTAVSGTTPSMTLSVDWSNDGTNWSPADPGDSFAAVTANIRRFKNVSVKGRYMRLSWAISGTTPSFTFEVKGLVLS